MTLGYYPFGLKQKGYNYNVSSNGNALAQAFKYNGVELNESLGLDLYEMDFRSYDPAIGRFNGLDPVVHFSQGTSVAFDNNPIFWADPSGADAQNGGRNGSLVNYGDGSPTTSDYDDFEVSYGAAGTENTAESDTSADGSSNNTPDEGGGVLNADGTCCANSGTSDSIETKTTVSWQKYWNSLSKEEQQRLDENAKEVLIFIGTSMVPVGWVFKGGRWVYLGIKASRAAKAIKLTDEAAIALKRLGTLSHTVRIKNGIAHIDIGFLRRFKPGDISKVENFFKAQGVSGMRVTSGMTVDKVIVKALNKRIQRGTGYAGYDIQYGLKAWLTGNRYILTKSLK